MGEKKLLSWYLESLSFEEVILALKTLIKTEKDPKTLSKQLKFLSKELAHQNN